MPRTLVAGSTLALVLTLAACGSDGESPPASPGSGATETVTPEPAATTPAASAPLAIEGAFIVPPEFAIVDVESDTCIPWGDYAEFRHPSQVTITDASNSIVATADLGEVEVFVGQGAESCVRWFETEVPAGGSFYTANVEGSSSETYTEEEVTQKNMVIEMQP